MTCHMFALICGIIGSVIMLINYNTFISAVGRALGTIFLIGIVGLFIILVVFSLSVIITLLKDAKSLKNNSYVSISGKVIRFKRNRDPESGIQINDKPIILSDTNEEIGLIINDKVVLGEAYKFNYLKNCKIAEIVEKINQI